MVYDSSEEQTKNERSEKNCKLAAGLGAVGSALGIAAVVSHASILGLSLGPVGWGCLAVGTAFAIGGAIGSLIFGSKAEDAKQEKNDAREYANQANSEKQGTPYSIDEGIDTGFVEQEKIDDAIDTMIADGRNLNYANHAYLSLSKTSDESKEITYSRYDVDSRKFDNQQEPDRTDKLNGFEETKISVPEEFKDFAEKLLADGEITDETAATAEKYLDMIANEDFVVFDVNGDGHINDHDRDVMRMLVEKESVKYVTEMTDTVHNIGYDVNGDGNVDEKDGIAYKEISSLKVARADLNKDGEVDEKDSEILNSYTTGLRNYYDRIGTTSKLIEEAVGENEKLMDRKLTEQN